MFRTPPPPLQKKKNLGKALLSPLPYGRLQHHGVEVGQGHLAHTPGRQSLGHHTWLCLTLWWLTLCRLTWGHLTLTLHHLALNWLTLGVKGLSRRHQRRFWS